MKLTRRLSIAIPTLFLVVALGLGSIHTAFIEPDGVMLLYLGRSILSGGGYVGWAANFWPPLYPVLTGILDLFVSGFWASKLVSIVAGTALVYLVYPFTTCLFDDEWIAVTAQVFVAMSPLFVKHAIRAENHMLDTFLFVSVMYLLLKVTEKDNPAVLPLGVAIGLATLTRFTSYILLPATAVLFVRQFGWRRAGSMTLQVSGIVVLLNSPVYVVNTLDHGSPLHTWKFLNIGYAILPDSQAFLWQGQALYDGPIDLILQHHWRFVVNYIDNLTSLYKLFDLRNGGPLSYLFFPALVLGAFRLDRRRSLVLLLPVAMLVGAICVAFIFPASMLPVYVALWLLAVWSLFWVRNELPAEYARYTKTGLVVVLVVLLVGNAIATASILGNFYASGDDFSEVRDTSERLADLDPNIAQKQIIGNHGSIAYYSGGRFVMAPLRYNGSVTEWVCYTDLSDEIRGYVPQAPPTDTSQFDIDYLVFTESMGSKLPQFAFLLDPDSDAVPSSFEPVYSGDGVTTYRIRTDCGQ